MKNRINQYTAYRDKIKKIKKYIALLGLFIFGALFLIQYFYRMDIDVSDYQGDDSKMVSPRYYGLDEKDRPYEIKAVQATQISEAESIFFLEKPDGIVKLSLEKWARVTADEGVLEQMKKFLTLKGNVTLKQDDGQEYHTSLAYIDFKTGYIYGHDKMHGFGPKGDIDSHGFEIYDYGQRYVFKGRASLTLPAKSAKNNNKKG